MGRGAAVIAGLLPEVAEILGELPATRAMEPDQARFRLFDAIATFLKNAAAEQHLLLVLDDLHWADEPSLLLLEFLARQITDSRLMVVGTYRDAGLTPQHPLGRTLAQLSRQDGFHRHLLDGLDEDEIGRFIAGETGFSPSPRLVDLVRAHTEGNPFFLAEVVRLLAERGELASDPDLGAMEHLAIPQGVWDVISQRLGRLSSDCNRVLITAAVIGRGFDLSLLGVLDEESNDDQLLGFVEEALAARVLEEVPEAGDRYQFTHALVQQTLLESLSNARKVRLHARVGEALETLYGDLPGTHAAELANHFSQAVPVLGPEKLVRYAMMAGTQAMAAYAHEEALIHFQQGLAAKNVDLDSSVSPEDDEAAELLFGLGQAQAALLRRGRAMNSLNRAFDYYARAGDNAKAVDVASYPMAPGMGRLRVSGLIAKGLELAPPNSLEAGYLLTRHARALGLEQGDYPGFQAANERALELARQHGDLGLELTAWANASEISYYHKHYADVIECNEKVFALNQRVENQAAIANCHGNAVLALLATGHLEGAKRHQRILDSLVEVLRHTGLITAGLFSGAALSSLEGKWDDARTLTAKGLESAPNHPALLWIGARVEYDTGNLETGYQYRDRLLEIANQTAPGPTPEIAFAAYGLAELAHFSGSTELLGQAEGMAKTVVSSANNSPFFIAIAKIGQALTSLAMHDSAASRRLYDDLLPDRGTMGGYTSIDHLLGNLSLACGDLDRAVSHFQEGYVFLRDAGYRSMLGWLCLDHSAALLQRGRPGDVNLAASLLEEAQSIADDLEMVTLSSRLTESREMMQSQPRGSSTLPEGLTNREAEVIKLIAQGRTDREIAEELIISVRTVTTHVGNILNKTGAANRAEAASFATRHGLA